MQGGEKVDWPYLEYYRGNLDGLRKTTITAVRKSVFWEEICGRNAPTTKQEC
jgi:hypothetical protein